MGNKPQIIISTTSTAIELEVKENKFWVKDVKMKEKEEESLEMIVIPTKRSWSQVGVTVGGGKISNIVSKIELQLSLLQI